MARKRAWEVCENGRGWVLRRQDDLAIVEFPTQRQAIRAGLAVCIDEGLDILRIQRADGTLEEMEV